MRSYFYADSGTGSHCVDANFRVTGPELAGRACGHRHRAAAAAARCGSRLGRGLVVEVRGEHLVVLEMDYDDNGAVIFTRKTA